MGADCLLYSNIYLLVMVLDFLVESCVRRDHYSFLLRVILCWWFTECLNSQLCTAKVYNLPLLLVDNFYFNIHQCLYLFKILIFIIISTFTIIINRRMLSLGFYWL